MACNVGGVERPIRMFVGAALLALGFLADLPPAGTWAVIVLGAVALVTGLIGYCPAWTLVGINTCHADHVHRKA